MSRKTVALVFLGSMRSFRPRRAREVAVGSSDWFRRYPELAILGDVEPVALDRLPVSGPKRWQAIADWVIKNGHSYQAMVMVSDRSEALPIAMALDLLLLRTNRTIIITIPSASGRDEWRTNVMVGLQLAVTALPGVVALDGNDCTYTSALQRITRLDFGIRQAGLSSMLRWVHPLRPMSSRVYSLSLQVGWDIPALPAKAEALMISFSDTQAPSRIQLQTWAKQAPTGVPVILLHAPTVRMNELPGGWANVSSNDFAVAGVQVAWAVGQGARWKQALRFASQRRS